MNYFNSLTELEQINTINLGDKATLQVNEFVDFVKPLLPEIKKGEAAKAKVAEYYLAHKDSYTDASKKMLDSFMTQVGVSSGYISQLKKAKEYVNSIQNPSLKGYVEEHPVTVQYRLAKSPHEKVMEKFQSGEHCSKREAESFTRVNSEDKISEVTEATKTEYQLKQQREQDLVDDTSLKYIYDTKVAQTYMTGTTNSSIASTMQKISNLTTCDEKRAKQLDHLIELCQEAKRLPSSYVHPKLSLL